MKRTLLIALNLFILSNSLQAQLRLTPTTKLKQGIARIQPQLKGFWQSIGDGYLLDASADTFKLYNYTDFCCYQETDKDQTDLLNTSSHFMLKGDTLHIYLRDFGDKSAYLQASRKFIRISALPAGCAPLTVKQQNDPEFLFTVFWYTLKENYAFEKERQLHWDEIYKEFRTKISPQTSKEELHHLMGEVVKLTKDQHTKIIYQGKTLQYTIVPSALLLREAFKEQDTIPSFDHYISLFMRTNEEGISKEILRGKGKKVANEKVEWGHLDKNIGYIQVKSFTGFTSQDLPRKQQIDSLYFYMEPIMKALQDKKAIILDISFNFGGADAAGLTISSFFTDKPVYAYTKYSFHKGNFYETKKVYIQPASRYTYTKPVYVLTSDISRSAAECFAMQMLALPHVKLVGSNTLGILSDMLGKSIGEYYLTLSNEKYVSAKGNVYEVGGVPPTIFIPVFEKATMLNSHPLAVRKVEEIINRSTFSTK